MVLDCREMHNSNSGHNSDNTFSRDLLEWTYVGVHSAQMRSADGQCSKVRSGITFLIGLGYRPTIKGTHTISKKLR